MAEQYDPFEMWEQEQSANDDPLVAIQHSLTLAQELQYHLANQPLDLRKDLGIEALKLLMQNHDDIRHHQYAVHVQHAYLRVKPKEKPGFEHMRRYGEMRLVGQIGYYTLQEFNEVEYILSLQLFEPKQLTVANERDKFTTRLPQPLTLPVAGIINRPVLVK
ncbi:MAG: hypothetical protein QG549_650 [Patescibacteria group bacterium]|jgi:hypothetical protein|nr:hypothetical protein [Patescibacteria group bacterium]